MIIDVHTHIGEYPKHWTYHAIGPDSVASNRGLTVEELKEKYTITWDKYMADRENAGVEKSVIMALDQTRICKMCLPDDYVYEFVRRNPEKLIGFSGIEPIDSTGKFKNGCLKQVEKAVNEYGFKGVGELGPVYSHYYPNDKTIYPVYQKALELEVPVCIHLGSSPIKFVEARYMDPIYVDDVARDFPDLKIDIAHMGYPRTQETLAMMRVRPNIYSDISALCPRTTILTWNLVMAKEYGVIDRIMFGTDIPSCMPTRNYVEWIRTMLNKQAERSGWPTFSQKEIDGILGENAARFLGI